MTSLRNNAVDKTARPKVVSFGCRLNTYESAVIQEHAIAAGRNNTIIVNTCAVTQEAERQGRQSLRRLRRNNPDAEIIATGCAVQLNPQAYADMPEIDRVIGNEDKMKAESFAADNNQPILISDIMTVRETASHMVEGFNGRTRAFVQIQQGCDHRCTFCIIPFARGNNRSVPMGRLFKEVRELVANGHKEIVLTGVDITGYGSDLPGTPTLGQLVRRLLAAVPDLPRLRLSSLDPAEADEDLFHVIANEPRLLPHFHISAQAGDDLILKRMKRRHLRQDIISFCDRIRSARPDTVFGADIIAGFPTETDAQFKNTLNLLADAGLTHLHIFPYSIRVGTPAALMPQVEKAVIKQRAAELRAAGKSAMGVFLESRVGSRASVLMEDNGLGNSEHFVPVKVGADLQPGALIDVTIEAVQDGQLVAA
jgi:threonylcarbamoyladenosine tRNA methylthiotransferase MtaB